MKHGNEIQKECQKKKKWKNIINSSQRLLRITITMMVTMLITVNLSSCSNNQSSWSLLKNKQFVLVENGDPSY